MTTKINLADKINLAESCERENQTELTEIELSKVAGSSPSKGARAGEVTHSEFSIIKLLDAASPTL
jgi:type VI protein secretion system component Hcp